MAYRAFSILVAANLIFVSCHLADAIHSRLQTTKNDLFSFTHVVLCFPILSLISSYRACVRSRGTRRKLFSTTFKLSSSLWSCPKCRNNTLNALCGTSILRTLTLLLTITLNGPDCLTKASISVFVTFLCNSFL